MTTSGSRLALTQSGNGPVLRFIFIPDGAEASAEALARIASPIRIPATFVPDAAGAGTRAEPRPGWSETFAPQSGGAGAAPAFIDGAAATENVAAGIDGAQRGRIGPQGSP